MKPQSTRALLRKAGAVVRSQGHHKGGLVRRDRDWQHSPASVVGALYVAMGCDPYDLDRCEAADEQGVEDALTVIHRLLSERHGYDFDAQTWSDEPDRTREHVLALYDDAIREVSP